MSNPDRSMDFNARAEALATMRRDAGPAGARRKRRPTKRRAGAAPTFQLTASHFKALATGLAIVAAIRLVRFKINGSPMLDQGTETYWITDVVAAMAAIYVVAKLVDWQCRSFLWWNLAGVLVMLTTMHNLVHYKPGIASQVFSPAYVETVLSGTTPNSIVFRDMILDKNGLGSLATGEGGQGGCGLDAITGLIGGGGDLVKNMTSFSDACF